jgi:endonuclease V-like protein UPF0215 family
MKVKVNQTKSFSLNVHKKGIRALGISESFIKNVSKNSILAGVVMRADMIVDGFTFSKVKVGGIDATQKIITMYKTLRRDDINILLLNGCIISWYNVIDLHKIADVTGLPLISVTYRESKGLETYIKENFPDDWHHRIEVYHKNGPRKLLRLKTNHIIYTRFLKLKENEALALLNKFTLNGAVPEPLRLARLLARSIMRKNYM